MHIVIKKTAKKIARSTPVLKNILLERDDLRKATGILHLEKGNLEAQLRELRELTASTRNYIASIFIKGKGIEIGATYLPVKLPKGTKVKYVDETSTTDLLERYPELKKLDVVDVNVVDNAEKLTKFKADSLDFIVANHFMEHTVDPIGTIINNYKKLRKNGVLFYAIPDKRYTFDKNRPITTYTHLLKEHEHPSHEMKFQHFLEAAELIEGKKGEQIQKRARELFDMKYSIHYHVWDTSAMLDMFLHTFERFQLRMEILVMIQNQHETIFVLRKNS